MSIKAILYSRFDPIEGPRVIHQVPEGSVASNEDEAKDEACLFTFASVSSFIIPRQSLCGNLISLIPPPPPTAPKSLTHPPPQSHSSPQSYRILGYPICLDSSSYRRNEFIFNFCLVLSANDPDFNAYKSIVTKMAHLMRSLEEQSKFLSTDDSPPNTGKLYSLCETLISDLNNYCECMIPIDELNTLNLKLFPTYPPPPPVKAWHVPIFTVRPESLMDENWDLTMQMVVPHINGVRSVKHIAFLADADIGLTKQCIKHLLYYGCLLLLDLFSFNAIYAPTAEFSSTIAADEDMQRECARYVNLAFAPNSTSEKLSFSIDQLENPIAGDDIWPLTSSGKMVDGVGIVELFAALKQGQSVREWYAENSDMLASIDLRRFITFGVIKGFVYRVHKYPCAANQDVRVRLSGGKARSQRDRTNTENIRDGRRSSRASSRSLQPKIVGSLAIRRGRMEEHYPDDEGDTSTITSKTKRRSRHRKHRHLQPHRVDGENLSNSDSGSNSDFEDEKQHADAVRLARYLDGAHCFDEICTELEISETQLAERLRRWNFTVPGAGEVLIIHR